MYDVTAAVFKFIHTEYGIVLESIAIILVHGFSMMRMPSAVASSVSVRKNQTLATVSAESSLPLPGILNDTTRECRVIPSYSNHPCPDYKPSNRFISSNIYCRSFIANTNIICYIIIASTIIVRGYN